MISVLVSGCVSSNIRPADESATAIDPATTQPSYWVDSPGAGASSDDFDRLWDACEEVARDFFFDIARTDYRAGVLTTEPLTSSQWFEFWRPDVRTIDDSLESSLAATRRTVRFEIAPLDIGGFIATPKVIVERQALAEQRITSVTSYRGLFSQPRRTRDRASGTREADEGVNLPGRYWYPVARDPALEDALVRSLESKLRR